MSQLNQINPENHRTQGRPHHHPRHHAWVITGVSLGDCHPIFMMESEMATTTMRCLAFVSMLLTKEPRTCKSVASEPGGDCISKRKKLPRVSPAGKSP
jgi:hypothetical protein